MQLLPLWLRSGVRQAPYHLLRAQGPSANAAERSYLPCAGQLHALSVAATPLAI